MKSQIVKRSDKPENVVEWKYLSPGHAMSTEEVWSTAQLIFKEYTDLRKAISAKDAKETLQHKYQHFSNPECFERLFNMITSDTMTAAKMHLVKRLVDIRSLADTGSITEEMAYRFAIETAAIAKSSPQVLGSASSLS